MYENLTFNSLVELCLGTQVIHEHMTEEEIDNIGGSYSIPQIERITKAAGIDVQNFWDCFEMLATDIRKKRV